MSCGISKKSLAVFIAAFTVALGICGCGGEENIYEFDNGYVHYVSDCNSGKLTVSSLENNDTEEIKTSNEQSNTYFPMDFEELVVEDGITSIGQYSFYRCTNLKSVFLSQSVTSIEDGAFSYCHSLNNITICNPYIVISDTAFEGCDLENINVTYVLNESGGTYSLNIKDVLEANENSGKGFYEDNSFIGESPENCIKYGVNDGSTPAYNLVVYQGGYYYFIVNDKLYKKDLDNTYVLDEYISTGDRSCISVCGDYIYYNCFESGTASIVRIRTDGKEREVIASDVCTNIDGPVPFLCDYENKSLFYIGMDYKNSSKLHPLYIRYNVDSKEISSEYMPEDYDGYTISSIEPIGISNGSILAIETYHRSDSDYKKVFAKIRIENFEAERVEISPETNKHYAFNDKQCFVAKNLYWGVNEISSIDLENMTYEAVCECGAWPIACHDDRLIVTDMCFLIIDRFPELYGTKANDDYIKNGSVIDGHLYYSVSDDNNIYKQFCSYGITAEIWELFFDPQTEVITY